MVALRLMMPTWFRIPGLLLLVGLAAGCGQERGSGSDISLIASLDRGRDAFERQDFATAADAYALFASMAPTDGQRAKALVLQSVAELYGGRPAAALETTKRAEAALQQADGFDSKIHSRILLVRMWALRDLGRSAEALEVSAAYHTEEKVAEIVQRTSVDPDSGPVPHGRMDMHFLPQVGNMRLREISRFDPDGSDMAGHYDLIPSLHPTAGPLGISAYVTQQPPGDLREDLATVVEVIQIDDADARLVEPAHRVSVAAADGTRVTGWRVVLLIPSLDAYTEAMLFKSRGAVVKFRTTYPVPLADDIVPEIRSFLHNFDWPPVDPPGMDHG